MWGVADKKQNALEKYVKKTEMEISVMGKNEAWKGKGKQYNFKYNGKDVFTKKGVRKKKKKQAVVYEKEVSKWRRESSKTPGSIQTNMPGRVKMAWAQNKVSVIERIMSEFIAISRGDKIILDHWALVKVFIFTLHVMRSLAVFVKHMIIQFTVQHSCSGSSVDIWILQGKGQSETSQETATILLRLK